MSSLVGYGVSSESESEEELESRGAKTESEKEKARNFLVESASASASSSESEPESDQEPRPEPQAQAREDPPPSTESLLVPTSPKLPPPVLGGVRVPSGSSVFANPFKERAEAKLSALQKHVQLTLHPRPTHIGGKRVCVAYRKDGRCRFGISCKFAHDSDLQNNAGRTVSENTHTGTYDLRDQGGVEDKKEEEEEEGQSKRKKHKVGISDSLVPPKRALKQYAKHKSTHS